VLNQRTIWLGAGIACGLVALLFVGIILVPHLLYPPLTATDLRGVPSAQSRIQLQQAQSQLANDARSAVLQGLAGLLVVIGAIATWRQVHVSREGQLTDRFSRAVDQLGSQNVDVRIGALYALERIARNSPADRNPIQYMLGAFIRTHMPWPVGAADGPEHPTATVDEQLPWMRVRAPDIQAAMGVLGRIAPSRDQPVIYLSRVDLRSIALRRVRLSGAKLRYANLARAVLEDVWLDRSDLTAADLRRAFLEDAHFNGAILSRAWLQAANLRRADLSNADLRGANLADAILDSAVLTGAQADHTTIWPDEFDPKRRQELGIAEPGQVSASANIPAVSDMTSP
jgi:hypothetical protein